MAVPPRIGQVVDGWRYTGGDPGNRNSWEQVQAPQPERRAQASETRSNAPRMGQLVDGWRYIGGDPGNRRSWERAPGGGEGPVTRGLQRMRQVATEQDPAMLATRTRELDAEERRLRGQIQAYDALLRTPGAGAGIQSIVTRRSQDAARLEAIARERQVMQEQGRTIPRLTGGQRAAEMFAAIPREAIRGVASIAGPAGILGEGGEEFARGVYEGGERIIRGLGLEQSERTREALEYDPYTSYASQMSGAVGSTLPFIATSVIGGTAKAAAIARGASTTGRILGGVTTTANVGLGAGVGSTEARQRMDQFEQETGQQLDPETRQLVTAGGAAIGLTEMLPLGAMLGRAPGPVRQAVTRAFTPIIANAAARRIAPEAARAAVRQGINRLESTAAGRMFTRGFIPEGAQEGTSQLLQNIVEGTYDPTQSAFEGVPENALLGGLVGGTVRGGTEAVGGLSRRVLDYKSAADRDIASIQGDAPAPVTFDIIERDQADPSRTVRSTVEVLNLEGDRATIRRPDGNIQRLPIAVLESRIAPEGDYAGFATPESFSADNIRERLFSTIAGVKGEESGQLQSYADAVSLRVSNALSFGEPARALSELNRMEQRFTADQRKKGKKAEPSAIADPRQSILNEARSIITDYQAEFGRSQAKGVTVGTEQATPKTGTITDMIERNIAARRAEDAQRAELLRRATERENNPDFALEEARRIAASRDYAPLEAIKDNIRQLELRVAGKDQASLAGERASPEEAAENAVTLENLRAELAAAEAAIPDIEKARDTRNQEITRIREATSGIGNAKKRLEEQLRLGIEAGIIDSETAQDVMRQEGYSVGGVRTGAYSPHEWFNEQIESRGFYPVTAEEAFAIRDAVRTRAQFETATAKGQEAIARENQIKRWDIIEPVIADRNVSDDQKANKINADLERAGMQPLTEDEVRTVYGAAVATDMFGPAGRMDAQRKAILDEVMADESIPANAKVREFNARLEEVPELAAIAPTEEEVAALSGTADLEAEIEQAPTSPEAQAAQNRINKREELFGKIKNIPTLYNILNRLDKAGLIAEDRRRAVLDTVKNERGESKYELGYRRLRAAIDTQNAADQEIIDAERAATTDVGGVRGAAARAVPARPGVARPSVPTDGVTDGGQQLDTALTEGEPASTEEAIARLEERRAELEAAPAAEEAVTEEATAPEPTPTPEQNAAYEPGSVESQMADSPNTNRPLTVGLLANFQARFGKALSTLTRKFNYKYQDAVDYSKQLARAFGVETLPSDMNLSRRFEMFESRKTGNQTRLFRNHVQPIIDLMKKLNLDPNDVGMYLWARSAKDRNKLVAARNSGSPDKGSGLTDAEAEAILQHYETAENGDLLPKLKQVAKKHDQLVDYMLNMRVKEGLLTREQVKAARSSQPFYAALKGFADDGDMQLAGEREADGLDRYNKDRAVSKFTDQIGTRISEFTQSKGRRSMPLNPLFNLIADAQQLIAHAETNRVGRTLLQNIRENPDEHKDIARVYTDTDPKVRLKPSEAIAYPDGTLVKANMQQEVLKGNLLVVKEGGKVFYIEFANTDAGNALKRAFSNMTPVELRGLLGAARSASIGLKSVLTRYSPFYLPVAYMRDTQDAVLTAYAAQKIKGGPAEGKKLGERVAFYLSPKLNSIVPGAGLVTNKAARELTAAVTAYVRGKEPKTEAQVKLMLLLDQMVEDGGSVGHAMLTSAETVAKDAVQQLKNAASLRRPGLGTPRAVADVTVGAAGRALDATAQIIDLNARFATYVAALDLGISREDAASLALDSSLNLTRRGEWAGVLDTLFFFTSPTIESARKLTRMGVRGGAKFLANVAVLGALSALWNAWMGGDDEDEDGQTNYQEVPEYIKQTRLVLFYGSGADDYLSIPMGFLLALPKYIGETTTNAGMGIISSPETAGVQIADALTKVATGSFAALSPLRLGGEDVEGFVSGFVPGVAKPVGDLLFNRNYFGSPIYNQKNEYDTRLASELGRAGTSDFYKWVARSMNNLTGGGEAVSGYADFQPEVYQYLVRQYGGGVEKAVRQTYTLATEGVETGGDKSVMEQIPVLNVFFGRGSEYTPMNEYYDNTEESVGRPSMDNVRRYTDRDTEGISREQREAFIEENESDYPYMFDRRVIRAYEDADKALDDMYKRRREDRSTTADADALREVNDSYEEEARQIYANFNRVFYEVKREYDAQ